MMQQVSPPHTIDELLQRTQQLAGKTLGRIAAELGLSVPDNLLANKGWVGQLLEYYLGADAGNIADLDFTAIGVEMKTMPLNKQGQPKESTYVCTVNSNETGLLQWEQSWVRKKLSRVLWVPVEADASIPVAQRFVGQAWLWRPSAQQEAVLRQDWEELMDRLIAGEQADISACEGDYLQIRPKAANSKILVSASDGQGERVEINPRGFYLRTKFTRELLAKNVFKL